MYQIFAHVLPLCTFFQALYFNIVAENEIAQTSFKGTQEHTVATLEDCRPLYFSKEK